MIAIGMNIKHAPRVSRKKSGFRAFYSPLFWFSDGPSLRFYIVVRLGFREIRQIETWDREASPVPARFLRGGNSSFSAERQDRGVLPVAIRPGCEYLETALSDSYHMLPLGREGAVPGNDSPAIRQLLYC